MKYIINGRSGSKVSRLPANAVLHQSDLCKTDYVDERLIVYYIKKIYVLSD